MNYYIMLISIILNVILGSLLSIECKDYEREYKRAEFCRKNNDDLRDKVEYLKRNQVNR